MPIHIKESFQIFEFSKNTEAQLNAEFMENEINKWLAKQGTAINILGLFQSETMTEQSAKLRISIFYETGCWEGNAWPIKIKIFREIDLKKLGQNCNDWLKSQKVQQRFVSSGQRYSTISLLYKEKPITEEEKILKAEEIPKKLPAPRLSLMIKSSIQNLKELWQRRKTKKK